jgi:hypothetical protein
VLGYGGLNSCLPREPSSDRGPGGLGGAARPCPPRRPSLVDARRRRPINPSAGLDRGPPRVFERPTRSGGPLGRASLGRPVPPGVGGVGSSAAARVRLATRGPAGSQRAPPRGRGGVRAGGRAAQGAPRVGATKVTEPCTNSSRSRGRTQGEPKGCLSSVTISSPRHSTPYRGSVPARYARPALPLEITRGVSRVGYTARSRSKQSLSLRVQYSGGPGLAPLRTPRPSKGCAQTRAQCTRADGLLASLGRPDMAGSTPTG